MGLINKLIEKRTSSLANPSPELVEAFTGGKTASGVSVTPTNAMGLTGVFACVNILSSSMAAMPLPIYRQLNGDRKEKAKNHPAYRLLHDEPNPEMHSYTFRQMLIAHFLLRGNGYAEIERGGRGEPVGLWPIPPWKVTPKRDNGLKYTVRLNDGSDVVLDSSNVIHIRGLCIDGLQGLSPIGVCRESLGITKAIEEYAGKFFSQGANFGGVVTHPDQTDQAQRRMEQDLDSKYVGLGKSHRLMFLREGFKYERAGIPPEDAQFLETKQFQLTEVARIYNVPLHLLQMHEKSTSWGSGIEQLNLGFVIFSLTPHLVNFEKEFDRKLLESTEYYTRHNVESLLRGDSKARSEYYRVMTNIGAYTINDVREKEDKDRIGPEGDINWIPMNMMPATQGISAEPPQRNIRAKIPAINRGKIAHRWERNFKEAGSRIVKQEANNLRKNAKKHFDGRSVQSWELWLEKYYDDFGEFISRQIKPTFLTFAEEINSAAASEVVKEAEMGPLENKFVDDYLKAFTLRYSQSSLGQMRSVAEKAIDEGEDPVEAIETRLTEWEERRPGKIAMRETVQLSNAMALFAFASAGVTRKVWVAQGDDSCPFCQELDGQVVGINEDFVRTGEVQADEVMKVKSSTGHPTLHEGCECQIVAG